MISQRILADAKRKIDNWSFLKRSAASFDRTERAAEATSAFVNFGFGSISLLLYIGVKEKGRNLIGIKLLPYYEDKSEAMLYKK